MKKRKYFIMMKEEGTHNKLKRNRILGLLEGICYDEPNEMERIIKGVSRDRNGEIITNHTVFVITTTNKRYERAKRFIENYYPGLCTFHDIAELQLKYEKQKL